MCVKPGLPPRRAALGAPGLALLLATGPLPAAAEPAIFASPEAAVAAVVEAIEARDAGGLVAVFGPENEDVVLTGDLEDDRETWRAFLAGYRAFHRIEQEDDGAATLYIGRDVWPFPAPLVRGEDGWAFDAAAAREEVRLRRIGQNELDVIDLMRGYVRAQAAYRAADPDGDGLPTFASGILSAPGTRDGLYWPPGPDAPQSPIGDFMARAAADGYSFDGIDQEPEPYLGYYFRLLTRQGPSAPGGAMDYLLNGRMVAGHALLAFPGGYGESGVMSFMVGEAGVVYEADLGEDTLAVAGAIKSFDPGAGWSPVADE
jgi:hypothetical protein